MILNIETKDLFANARAEFYELIKIICDNPDSCFLFHNSLIQVYGYLQKQWETTD